MVWESLGRTGAGRGDRHHPPRMTQRQGSPGHNRHHEGGSLGGSPGLPPKCHPATTVDKPRSVAIATERHRSSGPSSSCNSTVHARVPLRKRTNIVVANSNDAGGLLPLRPGVAQPTWSMWTTAATATVDLAAFVAAAWSMWTMVRDGTFVPSPPAPPLILLASPPLVGTFVPR